MLQCLLFVLGLVAAGCTSDTLPNQGEPASTDLATSPATSADLAGPHANVDLAGPHPVVDLAGPHPAADMAHTSTGTTPFVCGNATCGAGMVCCVTGTTPACAASCSGGFVAQCRGPENCGGNPCCVNVTSGFNVHDVSCTTQPSDCPPAINVTTGTGQDRACHVDDDCTAGAPGTSLGSCCTSTTTGQHICFNSLYVAFVKGFTCP